MKNFNMSFILNGIYFILVFVVALAFATLALARKLNAYDSTRTPLILNVNKEEIVISNSTAGKIDEIHIETGQHVRKGDLILQLSDDATTAKISSLEKVAPENLSARTEALILKAQSLQNEIRAPRDGIIYKIEAVEGSYLASNFPVIRMFADNDIKLIALVDSQQFAELQKTRTFDVFSSRLGQTYSVVLEGVGKVLLPSATNKESQYEVHFRFVNPEDGITFIEGEDLEVIAKTSDSTDLKPSQVVKRFWNSFIIGK